MLSRLSRGVGHLSVSRKLMLIYLLDLTSVFFVAGILINEKFIAIDFARKELAGSAYVHALAEVLVETASAPLFAAPSLNASGQAAPAPRSELDAAAWLGRLQGLREQATQQDERMRSSDRSAPLLALLAAHPDGVAFEAVDGVLARGQDLLTRVGNQSNLILDPDLDSYYTMSIIVLRLPELLQVVHGLSRQMAASRSATRETSVGLLRSDYLVLEGRLDAVAGNLESDLGEALAAGGPALRQQLEPSLTRLRHQISQLRTQSRGWVDGGMGANDQQALLAARVELLGSVHLAWHDSLLALDDLLDQRVDRLLMRMWLHLGTAVFLLLCIFGLVSFIARQIARPLQQLSSVADTVRRTGNHQLRVDWSSRDEIGRLVDAFHDMLSQLESERERQKELSARERAAEAQRSLVEAMPMPLLVTAVPGHEVLHLNGPAQHWVGDRLLDPWALCLDAGPRARFFQALHDRDAVNEFEVQWRGPHDSTWAMLSARRVVYQGRDAVLTTLSPISHLKQLEQRLELWAKVFETSSEGIFIVDESQRVLTANQALTHSTGHDLIELIGSPPAALLADADAEQVWATITQGVQRRGSWQGEVRIRRRDHGDYPAWLLANAVRDRANRVSHWVCTSIDITDRKESERRIRFLAEHDVLTELPNRALCLERLGTALAQAKRHGQKVGVLFIDLDRFKTINDSLGHHVGDGLLRSVARRLESVVRAGDTVSRLGGDEFVVILNGIDDVLELSHAVDQRLIPQVRAPHLVQGAELHVSCSVGIAVYPDDATDLDELMRQADVAMYQAKAQGRNGAQFFTAEMNRRAQQRLQIERHLRGATAGGELELHFQPRIGLNADSGDRRPFDAPAGRVVGMEALLRWHSPELGLVMPDRFIPVAEETGLIIEIGSWVIEQACVQLARWRGQGLGELMLSINLSALQLRDPGLIDTLRDSLLRHAIEPGQLELELTESTLMDQVDSHLVTLHALRDLGLSLAIDDFGTGYSSLNYLNRLPIDQLKIDRSFVHDMLDDPRDLAIIKAIIGLGHTLGLRVVAEGVEREREVEVLRAAGCDEVQGYLYARPMPLDAAVHWLRRWQAGAVSQQTADHAQG